MAHEWKFGVVKHGGDYELRANDNPVVQPVFYVQPDDGGRQLPTTDNNAEAWVGRRVRFLERGGTALHLALAEDHPATLPPD